MDRFKIFHRIISECDLSSMRSILVVCLDELMAMYPAERAVYLAIGVGGPRVLAARTDGQTDIAGAGNLVPKQLIQKVQVTKAVQSIKMPIVPAGVSATASWSRVEVRRIIAIPIRYDGQLTGIGYFERKGSLPAYLHSEIHNMQCILQDVENVLNNSRKYEKQNVELDALKKEITKTKINMISEHPQMLRLFKRIAKLAKVPSTVLIHGESGTGKELVAEAIYNLSGLRGQLISMNCGAIEPNLMKSELFGHVKGSFTGAHKDRVGLFKKAENGILFMDEIGEMPMDMQVTLLRTLESGEIMAVGSDRPQYVNSRVVAATHRDLAEMVKQGTFRNDLFQRLKGITLLVPPLRERRSDVPLLADFFMKKYNEKLELQMKGFKPEAMELLLSLGYESGNVRELQHIIERAMVFEDDPHYIGTEYLDESDGNPNKPSQLHGWDFEAKMNQYAGKLLSDAIAASAGNKTKAMKLLGLPRTTFYSMLNRYGISESGG